MSVALQKIDGVAKVEVSLNAGDANIRLEPTNRVSVEQIREAIRKNGFTPKEAEVTVVGKLVERGGRLVLEVSGPNVTLALSGPRAGELQAMAGTVVVLGGLVPEAPPGSKAPLTLEVRSFAPAGA